MWSDGLKWECRECGVKIAYDGDFMYLSHDQISQIRFYGYKRKVINNIKMDEYETVPFFGSIKKLE